MADDITLPGTAAVVATDDVGGGRQVQLMKVVDGRDGATNPLAVNAEGEASVSVDDLAAAFTKALGGALDSMAIDPTTGRLRVSLDAIAAALTLATITTVGTVTTVSTVTTVTTVTTCSTVTTVGTVTNKAQEGGIPSNSMVFDIMDTNYAECVRGRIA